MKYSAYRESAITGDLILFSGKGRISNVIKWFTSSKYSHVGLAVRSDYDQILIWHSTTLCAIADIDTGRFVRGVQVNALSQVLKTYDGKVYVRQLLEPFNEMQKKEFQYLRKNFAGRPYEKSECELIKSAWDGPFGQNTEDLSSIFCSELVAEAYKHTGLLGSEESSNEYTPADFADDRSMPFLDSVKELKL